MKALDLGTIYQQLDNETRVIVQREDEEFDRNMGEANTSFVHACKNLQRIHEALRYKRPGFVDYCNSKPGLAERTAYKMLDVAKMFADSANISIESKEALYLLAAPSTPDEIRQDFIEQAQNGQQVTYSNVKTALGIHKTVTPLVANGGLQYEQNLDAALDDQSYPVCPDCGQVYDGNACPDCQPEKPYNYKRDNRRSVAADIYTPQGMDACQTPAYALDPILPYVQDSWTIWEPAAGEGLLVEALYDSGFSEYQVKYGDILTGQNFFDYEPDEWDCLITNPPYTIQFQWLERCYQLGKPFALLLKVEILGTKTAQEMFNQYGIEVIFVSPRINFKMPHKGWDGGGAQFPTAWFTHGLNIGQQMSFTKVTPDAD